jgi:hypothetical protein
MMCDFVTRTNWSNIESNYFANTIIIFNLSYCTNITITITFVNQPMLCCALFFFPLEMYPQKSGAIFHIDVYIVGIYTEAPKGINKLYHVKQLAVFQNKPFALQDSRINHHHHYWNKCMLIFVQINFCNHRA